MDVALAPIAPADRQAIIDLFNYYIEHGFSAFAEQVLPYAFLDRLLELAHGYPTVTAKDPEGRLLAFGLLLLHYSSSEECLSRESGNPECELATRSTVDAMTIRHITSNGTLRPRNPFPTFAHTAEITYFVAPGCTRQGLGSRMLAELETRGKARGIPICWPPSAR